MSNHDMSLRTHTNLQMKDGVTLTQILDAMAQFLKGNGVALEQDEPGEFAALASENDGESYVSLDSDGKADFNLACSGAGHGYAPDLCAELCEGIRPLMQAGGVVEWVDHDISAANAESVGRAYLAPEGQEAANDGLEIALAVCAVELHAVLGTAGVELIASQIRDLAARTASA
jgi:hypothetical protein